MHQVSTQQLANHIPLPLRSWAQPHVFKWLQLNQVPYEQQLFQSTPLTGLLLSQINPNELIKKYGFTQFIAKQIVEWVEEESPEFDELVAERQQAGGERQQIDGDEANESESRSSSQKIMEGVDAVELEQNQAEQEQKKEFNDVTERIQVGKWERKKSVSPLKIEPQAEKQRFNITPPLKNPHVKFISSQLICGDEEALEDRPLQIKKPFKKNLSCKLRLRGEDLNVVVFNEGKIGRQKTNEVCIPEDSVSRRHAQIRLMSVNTLQYHYCLIDLKSKFGTFVKCNGPQTNIEGCSFLIEETEVMVYKIEIKKPSPTNKQRTFDIVVKIDGEDFKLASKVSILIGNRKNADIKMEGGCARICMDKDKKICYIEAVEGGLYRKLKPQEPWDIQAHLNTNNKTEVCFGVFKCQIECFQVCDDCNHMSEDCHCA